MAKSSRPPARQTVSVVVIILGLLVTAGIYFLFTAPARHAQSSSTLSLSRATNAYDQTRSQYTQARSLGAAAGSNLYHTAHTLDALLPPLCSLSGGTTTTTIPPSTTTCFNYELYPLVALDTVTRSAGMKLTAPSPGVAGSYQGSTYYQYTFTVTGTYAQLTSLLHALVAATPLTTVNSVSVTSSSQGLSATVIIDVWYSASSAPST